jgi:hypothetical protein
VVIGTEVSPARALGLTGRNGASFRRVAPIGARDTHARLSRGTGTGASGAGPSAQVARGEGGFVDLIRRFQDRLGALAQTRSDVRCWFWDISQCSYPRDVRLLLLKATFYGKVAGLVRACRSRPLSEAQSRLQQLVGKCP